MMPALGSTLEAAQQRLKDEFAKQYRMRQARSLIQVKQKKKTRPQSQSLTDGHMQTSGSKDQKQWKSQMPQQNQQLKQTLRELNFQHHNPQTCLCGSCNCGRHLCRLDVIKPDLKKQSTYRTSFSPKQAIKQETIVRKQVEPPKGSYLDIGTEYGKKFRNRLQERLERPHPKDNLRFEGPAQEITTYGQFHPGHKGPNQYIKPSNRHKRGEYPLMGKSTYATEFLVKSKPWDFDCREPDHLRTGSDWYGTSTYNQQFKSYDSQHFGYGSSLQQKEKYEKTPQFGYQFQTIYNKEFVKKKAQVCPSKVMLQEGLNEQFCKSKSLFQENSDYKAMTPGFKPFSTSKYSYV